MEMPHLVRLQYRAGNWKLGKYGSQEGSAVVDTKRLGFYRQAVIRELVHLGRQQHRLMDNCIDTWYSLTIVVFKSTYSVVPNST